MSCVKLSSFCGKSSKRTGRQTRQDRASQHNGHRAEHGLHERCCARVRGVARVVRDMAAVESGVRRSRRCRAWSDPAPSPAGAAQSPAAAAAASERPKRAAGQGACTVVGSIVGATSNNRSYILNLNHILLARSVSRKKSLRIRLPPHLIPTRDVTRQQAPKHRCVTWAAASAAGTQLKCTRHTQLKAGHARHRLSGP